MRQALRRLIDRLRPKWPARIDIAAARPLAHHVTVYVVDVDGKRTVFAASPHAICLLSHYAAPHAADALAGPNSGSV